MIYLKNAIKTEYWSWLEKKHKIKREKNHLVQGVTMLFKYIRFFLLTSSKKLNERDKTILRSVMNKGVQENYSTISI